MQSRICESLRSLLGKWEQEVTEFSEEPGRKMDRRERVFCFGIPQEKKKRILIDSDVKNEVDDQFAIVHALLSESFELRGIIPAHFGMEKSQESQRDSLAELKLLLEKMQLTGSVRIANGARLAYERAREEKAAEGVSLIIEEALQAKKETLYLVCLGPLTDLALALTIEPEIAGRRVQVIWIGGLSLPGGGAEPNLAQDVKAAQLVMDSKIPLWQVPRDVYSMLPVSFAELYMKVRPYGEIGKYLAENVVQFNNSSLRKPAEYRVLGDSPAIGLLLNQDCGRWTERNAPVISEDMRYGIRKEERKIRVYESIDSRFILEDFFAKLKLWGKEEECRQNRESEKGKEGRRRDCL